MPKKSAEELQRELKETLRAFEEVSAQFLPASNLRFFPDG